MKSKVESNLDERAQGHLREEAANQRSIRHAPDTYATLHPGAARYYQEQGALK